LAGEVDECTRAVLSGALARVGVGAVRDYYRPRAAGADARAPMRASATKVSA
jgi:hypothetical protein